jgi:hypothetical protein
MCACEPGFTCRRCADRELDNRCEVDEQAARDRYQDAGESRPEEVKGDG